MAWDFQRMTVLRMKNKSRQGGHGGAHYMALNESRCMLRAVETHNTIVQHNDRKGAFCLHGRNRPSRNHTIRHRFFFVSDPSSLTTAFSKTISAIAL